MLGRGQMIPPSSWIVHASAVQNGNSSLYPPGTMTATTRSLEATIDIDAQPTKKGDAGAPPLSGADWLLVNRQTTISDVANMRQQKSAVKQQLNINCRSWIAAF